MDNYPAEETTLHFQNGSTVTVVPSEETQIVGECGEALYLTDDQQIRINGKRTYLGTFDDLEEAAAEKNYSEHRHSANNK
jgi:hypothetical protein